MFKQFNFTIFFNDCYRKIFIFSSCHMSTDLSRNRFTELPFEVCEYCNMEKLNCYQNFIKSIPDVICHLQVLTYINLRLAFIDHLHYFRF